MFLLQNNHLLDDRFHYFILLTLRNVHVNLYRDLDLVAVMRQIHGYLETTPETFHLQRAGIID